MWAKPEYCTDLNNPRVRRSFKIKLLFFHSHYNNAGEGEEVGLVQDMGQCVSVMEIQILLLADPADWSDINFLCIASNWALNTVWVCVSLFSTNLWVQGCCWRVLACSDHVFGLYCFSKSEISLSAASYCIFWSIRCHHSFLETKELMKTTMVDELREVLKSFYLLKQECIYSIHTYSVSLKLSSQLTTV